MIDRDHHVQRIQWLKPVPSEDTLMERLMSTRSKYPDGCEVHVILTQILEGSKL